MQITKSKLRLSKVRLAADLPHGLGQLGKLWEPEMVDDLKKTFLDTPRQLHIGAYRGCDSVHRGYMLPTAQKAQVRQKYQYLL